MNLRTALTATSAIGTIAVLVVSSNAIAAGPYHPSSNEAGATHHPEHASANQRNQVTAELSAATKHPAWGTAISRGAPWPVAKTGEPKSRSQVNAELATAMKSPAWNSVSRGAPWPPVLADAK